MEVHIVTQMKDVGERIGNLPAFSEPRLQLKIFIAPYQTLKDQFTDPLRLCVGSDSRIKAQGRAFDQHDSGLRIWPLARTARERQAKRN